MAINYTEKGYGLHEKLEASGYVVTSNFGQTIAFKLDGSSITAQDESNIQLIIDTYDPFPEECSKFESEVDILINNKATDTTKGYVSQERLTGYVNSTNSSWASDAVSFIAWRDKVWESVFLAESTSKANGTSLPSAQSIVSSIVAPW